MNIFDRLFGDIYNNELFQNQNSYPSRPFWLTVLAEDEEELLRDVMARYTAHYESNSERIQRMRYNILTWAGLQYFPEEIRIKAVEGLSPQLIESNPRLVSHNVQRLVRERVTTEMLYPAEVSVVPVGEDFEGSVQAEAVKIHLDGLALSAKDKTHREIMFRRKNLCGEAYRYIYWNQDAGELSSVYKRRKAAGKPIQLIDESGNKVSVSRAVYQGEVDEALIFPWDVGLEPRSYAGYCQWGFMRYWAHVDELKVDYPDKADRIIPNDRASEWSTDLMQVAPLKDHCLVVKFFARSNPYLPDGYFVKCTPDVVLEHGPNPYADIPESELGNIPFERLTDIDVDGSLYGLSQLQQIQPLANQYDQTLTRMGMNIYQGSRPKWLVPKGACNITRLGNQATVIQYSGSVAPQLVTFPTVPADLFGYKDTVKQDMEANYGSSSIARGEPPKGVTANAALQFLDAQQEEALTLLQIKADMHQLAVHRRRFAVISKFYDDGDERFSLTLGQDRRWMTRVFDIKAVKRPYKFQLLISSELPRRKDALMQTVFQMSQIWPGLFPQEAVVDMFKLGHVEKFMGAARGAHRAAEWENYEAASGRPLDEPKEFEDHIVHWSSHDKQLQHPQFRLWPEKRQQELIEHQAMHELLMLRKARGNMLFVMKLQQIPQWPSIIPLPPDFGQPAQAAPQGQPQAALPPPGEEMSMAPEAGALPQDASDPSLNQQRFPDGQFGQGLEPADGTMGG